MDEPPPTEVAPLNASLKKTLKPMSFATDMPFFGKKDPAIRQDFSHSIRFGAGIPGTNQPECEEIMLSKTTKLLSFIIPSKFLINHGPSNVIVKQIFWKMENETGEPKQFGYMEKDDELVRGDLFTERRFTSVNEITSLIAAMAVELKIKFPLVDDDTANRSMLWHTAARHCEKLKISRRHIYKIVPYVVQIHFMHTSTQINALALGHTWEHTWRSWYYKLVAPKKKN